MFHWLAQIDSALVVLSDDIQAATQYYQPVQQSHMGPKSQHYVCEVKPYIIEEQYCKHE